MSLEATYRRHLDLTGNAIAAAILTAATLGQDERPLSAEQAAKALGVSRHKVYELCSSGKLRHRKVGARITIERADLDGIGQSGGKAVLRCLKKAG